jgi:rhodanese-related sulfurtransferase
MVIALIKPSIAGDVKRITKEELKDMLGKSDVIVIDVRLGKDWKASEIKIQGAVREEPGDIDSWASNYDKNKTLVLYCA